MRPYASPPAYTICKPTCIYYMQAHLHILYASPPTYTICKPTCIYYMQAHLHILYASPPAYTICKPTHIYYMQAHLHILYASPPAYTICKPTYIYYWDMRYQGQPVSDCICFILTRQDGAHYEPARRSKPAGPAHLASRPGAHMQPPQGIQPFRRGPWRPGV
jgi:hypothetical protein